MMDYTETYTDPNIKLDNGDPVLLWIRYQGSNKGNCTITIKGAYNPLPLNKIVAPYFQATRLKKWLTDSGFKYLGYSREI